MTTQTLILKEPRSATSFWHKLGNRCRAVAKAIRPRLADDELTAAQLYDVGLSDRRPVAQSLPNSGSPTIPSRFRPC